MDLLQKSKPFQNICGIEIDASAEVLPAPEGSLQPFSNTFISESNAVPVYFGRGSVSLQQQGKETSAGMEYQQKLTLRFPNSDLLSAERIQQYQKAKFIYIKLSGGVVYLFGRNDYYQNTKPKAEVKSTEKIAEVIYSTSSIFPLGLTNGSSDHQFPEALPINYFNL